MVIAIPTTAGTGSETTRNAVIKDPNTGVKASLRSQYLLPRVALVDPELTYSLPTEISFCEFKLNNFFEVGKVPTSS